MKLLLDLILALLLYIKLEKFTIIGPFKGHQGRRKTLNLVDLNILDSLVKNKKDWYLDEMVDEMERLTSKLISIPTLWRALKYLGITRKKIL
ncbi:unnamed protein product [Rhizophagus irregularis]|uniref:Uncharacterized protein n=1 Tax=Rhizophagus irregularis TaxID=588596 RepID=A0A915Z284_9GLOM|nr:unnamed protein product [Rhizophagus irregularis]CAB5359697.1 unnamed protein product [Rhizophagus irregularis]